MKKYLDVFIIAFICFYIAISLGSYTYLKTQVKDNPIEYDDLKTKKKKVKQEEMQEESIDTLEKAIKKSKRINFILLGMEETRSDTMIFISFNPENKKVDLISIPRDTYVYRKGYEEAEQRKINAVYGAHGINGVKKVVEYILGGVPIHNYIMVDYKGVEKIVDSIGGVEVMVPFHMKYSDPTANPPLYINIPEGKQTLKGKDAVKFLRYRKGNGNTGGYNDGDLGRVKAQQEFLNSFFKKTFSIRLPFVIKTSFDYVKTDVKLSEALNYGKVALGMKEEDFGFQTLPGVGTYKEVNGKTLSYYINDDIKTKEIMENIYGVTKRVPIKE